MDALSEILGRRPELTDLYLRGAHWRDILSEVVCFDADIIKDAVVIPAAQLGLLVNRLREIPDEPGANQSLYEFLATRASRDCLRAVLELDPDLLRRDNQYWSKIAYDPKLRTAARLYPLGLLADEFREELVDRMRTRFSYSLDASFLEESDLLDLFDPRDLIKFAMEVRNTLPTLEERAESIEENASDHWDVEMGFDDYRSAVNILEELFEGDEEVPGQIEHAKYVMEAATDRMKVRFPKPDVVWSGKDLSPEVPKAPASTRSIFSDVAR